MDKLAGDRKPQEYEALLKAQSDFFTNISHELKTPLSIILIQIELMKLYRDDPAKIEELIAVTEQNAYRLTRLAGNMLDLGRIESGFAQVCLVNADIVALVHSLYDSVKTFTEAKSICLEFHSNVTCRVMPVDMDKMERIVLNLLSNAIKHTWEGGHIRISLDVQSTHILLSVTDTGEGIPADKLEIIFDRFAQVDTSLTRKNGGAGIGLSLIKSFVGHLGGRIWVASEHGKGSTFYVELPVLPVEAQMICDEVEGMGIGKKVELEFSDIIFSASPWTCSA